MFLKTGELKKILKASLKKHGLVIGCVNRHYLVYSDNWGVYVRSIYASNKFKAALMELIGDLPEPEECYFYEIEPVNRQPVSRPESNYINPFERWKQAKDYAAQTPLYLGAWPHEYAIFQAHSDLSYLTVPRALTGAISVSELEEGEGIPGRPCVKDGVLYWKNEAMIFWAHSEFPGTKALTALFPKLAGLSFFEDSWILPEEETDTAETPEVGIEGEMAEELPY